MDVLTVRQATEHEIAVILSQAGRVFYESTQGMFGYDPGAAREMSAAVLQAGGYYLAAIDQDGSLCGWLLICSTYDQILRVQTGYLAELYVFKRYRGKGVGRRLMKEGIDVLSKNGFKTIQLNVYAGNPAKKMYERLGFRTQSSTMAIVLD
ncbi:GNAT family N-acetyltransferase [Bacillus marinisedimentorum]|uniref:GNAT family N-acetyltransferase n=1 Tax=Bacillus marinisedimentorum TaxID=1821260 RepID=UPI000872769D|nr:GNAT family N-acetyltransferase [Bacillus marinisedimentorum]